MSFLLKKENSALLVIDVQERINAVMADQGHLPRLEVLIEACREIGVPVLASEQYPQGLGPTVDSLAALLGDDLPGKLTFSCARDDGLRKLVDDSGRKQIIVTGIETHVCVFQTARDLTAEGYTVHVPRDTTMSRTRANWQAGLELMDRAGAVVTSAETVIFDLLGRAGTDQFKVMSKLVK